MDLKKLKRKGNTPHAMFMPKGCGQIKGSYIKSIDSGPINNENALNPSSC
jgi:hypothetical protein